MLEFERQAYESGCVHVVGVDEAGRGPLAGPVVAAAVVFAKERFPQGINDSKKLSEKQRVALFPQIQEMAVAYAISEVSAERIDEINIRQASFEAMRDAVCSLELNPDIVLVDGFEIPEFDQVQLGIVKGDSKSISIAAASILAKVTRDQMMLEYHELYPEYNFAKHKGYGTKEHLLALEEHGPCALHRKSFQPIKSIVEHS